MVISYAIKKMAALKLSIGFLLPGQ